MGVCEEGCVTFSLCHQPSIVQGSHCDISPRFLLKSSVGFVFMSRSSSTSSGRSVHPVFVCKCRKIKTFQKEQYNQTKRKTERMSRGRMKGKLITTKQMAPQFTVAPQGPGGTTLCTSRLPSLQRGAGRLNTTLCVHMFVC